MNRRNFIGSLALIGCAGAFQKASASTLWKMAGTEGYAAAGSMDDNLVVFISDLHNNPDGYQPGRLKRVISDILAMKPLPRNVIAMGDLAYLTGQTSEYEALKSILQPIEDAGITLTLAMGNHDRREEFSSVFPHIASRTKIEGKLVYVVETPHADIIVLDSLHQGDDRTTWITDGLMEEQQLSWLKDTLSSYKKPVFVSSHHPVHELQGVAKVLIEAPTCCGYIYGHHHCWTPSWIRRNYSSQRIVRTLCLPSTGHWGDIGYVSFRIGADKSVATLKQYEFYTSSPLDEGEKPEQWAMITEENDGSRCSFSYEMLQ